MKSSRITDNYLHESLIAKCRENKAICDRQIVLTSSWVLLLRYSIVAEINLIFYFFTFFFGGFSEKLRSP